MSCWGLSCIAFHTVLLLKGERANGAEEPLSGSLPTRGRRDNVCATDLHRKVAATVAVHFFLFG